MPEEKTIRFACDFPAEANERLKSYVHHSYKKRVFRALVEKMLAKFESLENVSDQNTFLFSILDPKTKMEISLEPARAQEEHQ